MSKTVKFSKSATTHTALKAAYSPALVFPNSDWSFGYTIVYDGSLTVGAAQYIARTGEFNTPGGFVSYIDPDGTISAYCNGVQGLKMATALAPGQAAVVVYTRSAGVVTVRMCLVTSTAPANGSAVIKSANTKTLTTALDTAADASGGLFIGDRQGFDRRFDNSLARLFLIDRALTDVEVAQLAYGMEHTDLSTPSNTLFYYRLDGATDLIDHGPYAMPTTVYGTLTDGTATSTGYSSAPVAPSLTGAPVINGTPQVSIATTYTPATANGTPGPIVTQQWTLDGVDIAGATGPSYTPVANDTGKLLQVRQTASNTSGAPASATSTGVVIANTTTTLTVVEQTAERIFQRIGGSAVVPMSGTYSGTTIPASLEYQLYAPDGVTVARAWASIGAATISGGTWTANPAIAAPTNGKKWRVAVRSKDSAGNVIATTSITVNRFGVGDIIIVVGSSTAWTWFNTVSGAPAVNSDIVSTYDNSAWKVFPSPAGASQMAEYFATALGVPTAMINCGMSGTTLASWDNPTGTQFSFYTSSLAGVGGKLAGVFISAGSNDSGAGGTPSKAAHYTKMKTLIDNVRSYAGQSTLPIMWSGFNRRLDAGAQDSDYIRMAENDMGDYANLYHVMAIDFELGSDGIHLSSTGFANQIVRLKQVWVNAMQGRYLRGPKITQMQVAGQDVTVTVTHRTDSTDISPASGITGWSVTDASGTPTILSVSRASATSLTVHCDRALVAPVVAKYLSGAAPDVTTPVFGNGTLALPLHIETELATTQGTGTVPVTDTTAPVLGSTLAITGVTQTTAVLTWPAATDNVAVTGYEYSIGGAAYVSAGTGVSTTVSNLTPGSAYSVAVRAYDAAGNRSTPITGTINTLAAQATSQSFVAAASRTVMVLVGNNPFSAGVFWSLADPKKPLGTKDPDSVLDITFDWTQYLQDIGSPAIAKVDFILANIQSAGTASNGAKATVFLSTGSAQTTASVTCRITTNTTPQIVDDRTVYIKFGDM